MDICVSSCMLTIYFESRLSPFTICCLFLFIYYFQSLFQATRQIDEGKRSDPVNPNLSDPFSTSLAATSTLMSGMNDITANDAGDQSMIGFDRIDALKHPDVRITPMPDESELIPQTHLGLDSQSPRKSDVIIHGSGDEEEEGRPSPASQQGQTEVEEDNEEFWQQQQQHQAGIEPACSTSQQGGDPMVVQKHDEIIVQEEADIIRDSESMSSSELIASTLQGSQQEIYDTDAKIAGTLKLEGEVEEDALQSQRQLENIAGHHRGEIDNVAYFI